MIYRFDRFEFDPDGQGLTESGLAVALEPQVFSLLKYLLANHGTIVSKDQLNEEIWGGRIVSESALTTRIRAVRRALGDDRTQQKFIKTFPKRGFQFVGDVELVSDEIQPAAARLKTSVRKINPVWVFLSILAFIAVASVTGWWAQQTEPVRATLPLPKKPSIAVMRFVNLSGSEDDRYFVDGLTEDIIANLSRYRELFVSSRNSTFTYPKNDIDPKRLAGELGVAFVARGSVRRSDGRVRVNAELIDAKSGATAWAERFDRDLTDIFAVQDEISQAIAGQLAPEIIKAGAVRAQSKLTEDLNAWDFYLKARSAQGVFAKESQAEAVRLALLAIARDQQFASAYSLIARAKGVQFFFGWSEVPEKALDDAIRYARRAIELDQTDPVAFATLGYIYRFTGDEEQAITNLERAANLNPNDADIRLQLAHTLDWFRKQERALPQIRLAIRLSPRDPRLQNMYFYKAHILFHLRRFEDSLAAAREMSGALTTDTWRVMYNLVRAANLAELGRAEDARRAADAAVKIKPKLSITAMKKQFEGSKNHPENRRIWLESLRKAGIPE